MAMAKWFVYVLEGSDGTFYSGITWRASLCPEDQIQSLGKDYVYQHGLKQISQVEAYRDLKQAQKRELELRLDFTLKQDNRDKSKD